MVGGTTPDRRVAFFLRAQVPNPQVDGRLPFFPLADRSSRKKWPVLQWGSLWHPSYPPGKIHHRLGARFRLAVSYTKSIGYIYTSYSVDKKQ